MQANPVPRINPAVAIIVLRQRDGIGRSVSESPASGPEREAPDGDGVLTRPQDPRRGQEKFGMIESKARRKSNLRWGVEQRLEFIEFRLYWEGRMNRSDLMNTFGVSVNQASTDLNRYLRLAPENMIYDKSARTYLRSSVFSPLFLRVDADQYLTQLRLVHSGVMEQEDAWIRTYPVYDDVPSPTRIVNPETLQLVLEAVRESESIEVQYQSLSRPEPRWRWIAPIAIGFDGDRWHVRAFCEEDKAFKDFLLARIIDARDARPRDCDPKDDRDWSEYVELEIGPHPDLSESQKLVVSLDYGMQDGRATLRVRRALVFYTLKRLGLDAGPDGQAPSTQQIVLLNREAIGANLPVADDRENS